MRLIGLTGRTIQEALSRITPTATSLERAKKAAGLRPDEFLTNPAAPLSLERAGANGTLVTGAKSLASISDEGDRYAFAPSFVSRYQALLKTAGVGPVDARTANGMLNTLLLRKDKPNTAAFVRTVLENPLALDKALSNMSRYADSPTNGVLLEKITDVRGAFERTALLPFFGSTDLATGLAEAMKKDLARGGALLRTSIAAGVSPDITIVGQGPTGAVLARGLSNALPAEVNAAVVGGETTFSAGGQWYLNSPNRAETGVKLGPGGPLNNLSPVVYDADLSGDYYAAANKIDLMSKMTLHSSGLPVLTENVSAITGNIADGYVLKTGSKSSVPTRVVALAAGLGDGPKPLGSAEGTQFVNSQYADLTKALAAAKNGDSKLLREYPLWSSTLDFFRVRDELNDPLSLFATAQTAKDLKGTLPIGPLPLLARQVKLGDLVLTLKPNEKVEFELNGKTVTRPDRELGVGQVVAVQLRRSQLETQVKAASEAYRARALYKAKVDPSFVPSGAKAQKVVAVIGLGDSGRTALEAITGFGPDARSPRQLNVVPKLLWYVGESGPTDCAEFYTGDLFKGFQGFNKALAKVGGPDLFSLFKTKVRLAAQNTTAEEGVRAYLNEFSQLLTTQKPKAYFDELLEGSGLTAKQKQEAFGVFLEERNAVRPRYNQLVIPIEKGQIEILPERVVDAGPTNAQGAQPERAVLLNGKNEVTLVDHVLDARGNVNDVAKVVSALTNGDKDPFNNPALYELVEVVDKEGKATIVGKKLVGHNVFLFGPASGVVSNNTTNVGANKVSIFLNRPNNEAGAEALAQLVAQQVKEGRFGTAEARAAAAKKADAALTAFNEADQISVGSLSRRSEATVDLARNDTRLRSALDRNPYAHQTELNAILRRISVRDTDGRFSVRITPEGANKVTIDGPTLLLPLLTEWAKTRSASAYLRSATSGDRSVTIERAVGANGRLVPVENWL